MNGVEIAYNVVTIEYFPTSVQKLYKIGDGEWKEYKGEKIPLELGQIVHAKGIDQYGKETNIVSYTSTLPNDAISEKAYDGNKTTGTGDVPTIKRMMIDDGMYGKQVELYGRLVVPPKILLKDGTYIELPTVGYNAEPETEIIEIPNGASEFILSPYRVGNAASDLYEITVQNHPQIKAESNYPTLTQYGVDEGYNLVTIEYFTTTAQRQYKIDDGEWKEYKGEKIQVKNGQTIYARGLNENGKEVQGVVGYTAKMLEKSIGPEAYDRDDNTYFNKGDGTFYMNIDSSMWEKKAKIKMKSTDTQYCWGYIFIILQDGTQEQKVVVHDYSSFDSTIDIPDNAVKIRFHTQRNVNLYEIQPII